MTSEDPKAASMAGVNSAHEVVEDPPPSVKSNLPVAMEPGNSQMLIASGISKSTVMSIIIKTRIYRVPSKSQYRTQPKILSRRWVESRAVLSTRSSNWHIKSNGKLVTIVSGLTHRRATINRHKSNWSSSNSIEAKIRRALAPLSADLIIITWKKFTTKIFNRRIRLW